VDLIHALLDLGREEAAAALLARAQAVAAYSLSYRDPSWLGPSAMGHPGDLNCLMSFAASQVQFTVC
jgi:hypothetical protein